MGDEVYGLIAEQEFGISEEGVVGGGDEPAGHFEDGVGGSTGDAGGEFLGLGFQFGTEGFGHGGLLQGEIDFDPPNYTEVNKFSTNYQDAYPGELQMVYA